MRTPTIALLLGCLMFAILSEQSYATIPSFSR